MLLLGLPAYAQPAVTSGDLTNQITTIIGKVESLLGQIRSNDAEQPVSSLSQLSDARFGEGAELILRAQLAGRVNIEGEVWARLENGVWFASLVDVISMLDFPIVVATDGGAAEGWYIRENRRFSLDLESRRVEAGDQVFQLSPLAYAEGSDILVPLEDIFSWFDIGWELDLQSQLLRLDPTDPLPLQEWLERRGRRQQTTSRPLTPSLPRKLVPYKAFTVPAVDIATRSELRRRGQDDAMRENHLSVTARGDIAYGTGTAMVTADDGDQTINQIRLNYMRESEDPDLLGPLQARRYELGDINPVRVPLAESTGLLWGARVTNENPDLMLRPETVIEGDAQPGWDVELYRDNTLLGLQTAGENGRYLFENISLFAGDNNFRLVFYGPQGEVREEYRNLVVDPRIGRDTGGIYDVSFGGHELLPYHQNRDIESAGDMELAANFEHRLGRSLIGEAGLRLWEEEGDSHGLLEGGLSTMAGGFLLDGRAAIDEGGALAGEITARRNFGPHRFANTTLASQKDFQSRIEANPTIFENRLSLTGPFDFMIGENEYYTINADYLHRLQGDDTTSLMATAASRIAHLTFNQSLNLTLNRDVEGDQTKTASGSTSMSGAFAGNRLRLNSNYSIIPDAALDSVGANVTRRLRRNLSVEGALNHEVERNFTTATAQANWEMSKATISPRISYDTDENLFVGVNTRFALMQEPRTNDFLVYPRAISGTGSVSALVFVDMDGDGSFSEGDELVEGAMVNAVQSGRRAFTDDKGIAVIAELPSGRPTDVTINTDTLPDPFWIPAQPGSSVLPRPGMTMQLDFPLVVAGEIEGLISGRTAGGAELLLRQVRVRLVDREGEEILTTRTASDGVFIFSLVPPDEYLLIVDGGDVARFGFAPPPPRQITITYEGTELYGENFQLEPGPNIPFVAIPPSEELAGTDYVLNLGNFRSSLKRVLALFQLNQSNILAGANLLEDDDNPLSLRAYWPSAPLDMARSRCAAAVAKNISCTIEVVAAGKML